MKMPRVRFTVRRMMVAVAIVAALLGLYVGFVRLGRISAAFRAEAQRHADLEKTLRVVMAVGGSESLVHISPGPGEPSREGTARAVAEVEATLKRKYERAARYPFLPVPPDPPEPE